MDDLQYQLQRAKRSTAQSFDPQFGAEPKWLTTMPEVYGVTEPFSRLIAQLPIVKATNNPAAMQTYFAQLVAEITKLYTYRVEIIELSDTIPEADKPQAVQNCLAEGRDYLAKLGAILSYGGE